MDGETQLRSGIFIGEKSGTLQDKQLHSKHIPVSEAGKLHTINSFSISAISHSSHYSRTSPSQLLSPAYRFFKKYLVTLARTTTGK